MAGFQKLQIDKMAKQAYSDQIVDQYIYVFQTGTLLVGAKMPSIRDLSIQLNINKIGVITAYNKLSDAGYIKAKPGSGYYVIFKPKKASNPQSTDTKPETSLDLKITSPIHISKVLPLFSSGEENITYIGRGDLPKNLGLMEDLRGISRSIFSSSSLIYQYTISQGYPNLRETIAFELEQKGMPVSGSEQILICNGAFHALNIVLDAYLKPNDHVLIEVPNFELLFSLLTYKKLHLIPLGRTPEKIVLDDEKKSEIRLKKPKIMIIYSNCHNPTSGILSSVERHELLNLAKEMNSTIIEMDLFKGLNFDDFIPPLLSAMDGFNRTIYISSYSKIFASGIRLGYIAASEERIQKFLLSKMLQDVSSSILDQQIVYEMLIRGIMKKYVQKLRDSYRSKRDTLISMLKKTSPQGSKWNHPEAGMFLWFEFPHGENLKIIEERSLEKKISISPGSYFYPDRQYSNFMRINFANLEPVQTYNALEAIFTIWRNASSRKWIQKK
jgi:DNA-binding transcriptional MocR family regulator